MEKLQFDDGLTRLEMNGGVLVFNPGDINLYGRLGGLIDRLPAMEAEYRRAAEQLTDGDGAVETALKLLRDIDVRIKRELNEVFGYGNDFDALLCGVNLMTVTGNGKRVITNLLDALMPYIERGTRQYTKEAAAAAVNRAQRRRAQRANK